MSIVKDLIPYTKENNFENIKEELQKSNYEIAYGNTYSIREVHQALLKGFPVIAQIGNKPIMVVGENPKSLIFKGKDSNYEINDSDLRKYWTGQAIIIMEKQDVPLIKADTKDECKDSVIFEVDRDTWDIEKEAIKIKAKGDFRKIGNLPAWALPIHPVIVVFKEANKEDKKQRARSYTLGAFIYIIDSSDPMTEFLHEVGHLYWITRLNEKEKEMLKDLHKKLDKEKLPAIFIGEWSWHDEQEMFSTLYMWLTKGYILSAGYLKIFEKQYREGWDAINKIFNRVVLDTEISDTWMKQEEEINTIINLITNKSLYLKAGRLFKAKRTVRLPDMPMRFPKKLVNYTILSKNGGREWVLVKAGLLDGKVIILRNDYIDFHFMKGSPQGEGLVPVQRWIRPTKKNIRPYKRTVWISIQEAKDTARKSVFGKKIKMLISKFKGSGKSKEETAGILKHESKTEFEQVRALSELDRQYPVDIRTDVMPLTAPVTPIDVKAELKEYKNPTEGKLISVALENISAEAEGQIRKKFDRKSLLELAGSIQEQGLLQPIIVRPDKDNPDKYKIVAGERRYRATKILQEKGQLPSGSIDVIVKSMTDKEKDLRQLIENHLRVDNTPIELAERYEKLVTEHKLSVAEVAKETGDKENMIRSYMRLNRLDPTIKMLLSEGSINKSMASILGTIEKHSDQVRVLNYATRKRFTVKQLTNYIRDFKEQGTFFELEDIMTDKQKRAKSEIGEQDEFKLQTKYKSFMQKQVDFVSKFLDSDDVDLSSLGMAVAGKLEGGIKEMEMLQQKIGYVVEKMKKKNMELSEPSLFAKAMRPVRSWKLNRIMKAFNTLQDEYMELMPDLIYMAKAGRAGLVPVKLTVTRGRSTFQQTYWIRQKVARILGKLSKYFKVNLNKAKDIPKNEYKNRDVKNKFGVSYEIWENHFTEYFKNKENWDNKFKTEKAKTIIKKKVISKKAGERKVTEKKVTIAQKIPDKSETQKIKKDQINKNLMRYIHGLYSQKKKPDMVSIPKKEEVKKYLTKEEQKTEIKNSSKFQSWFGKSKVLKDDGEPAENYPVNKTKDMKGKAVIVYHGTSLGGFDEFDKEKVGDGNLYGKGFYFTEDKGIAEEYSTKTSYDYKVDEKHLEKLYIGGKGDFSKYENIEQAEKILSMVGQEGLQKKAKDYINAMENEDEIIAEREKFFGQYKNEKLKNVRPEYKKQSLKEITDKKNKFINTGKITDLIESDSYDKKSKTIHISDVAPIVAFQKEYGIEVMPSREIKEVYLKIENPIDLDMPVTDKMIDDLFEQSAKESIEEYKQMSDYETDDAKEKKRYINYLKNVGGFHFKHLWDNEDLVKEALPYFKKKKQLKKNTTWIGDGDIEPTKENVKHILKLLAADKEGPPTAKGKPTLQHLYRILSDGGWSSKTKNRLAKAFQNMGHDGMSHTGGWNIGSKSHKVWVVFEPEQIKATTAKDFDLKSKNIYKAY